MGKVKNSAQQADSSKIEKHAEPEGSRRSLSDGEPESLPPRNDPSASDAIPEVTEELDSFNTANEKAPSEESDERTPGLGEDPSAKVPEADPQPQKEPSSAVVPAAPVTDKSP
ncbi:major latex allergen Hev b 5-like [Raphanus sativus]|uniref:Major latex allergen Hev b 5-like n=1 Tax=Raphanus sativus TaxID=3726 RepID=A0A6J0M017_RAPSA|nr:major latex allergen Hev b 5-like [Raphanus sativus]